MPEFTGERVIPGLVDDDLFNEHVSRYKFAARLVKPGAIVLDLGCGTGYGTVELSTAAEITGADISAEAVEHATVNYGRPGVRFLQAGCDALPLDDQHFDIITAFEVIEHLEDWRGLLREAKRLLKPGGLFTVSTPNKSYYAETRGASGPNPFHCHEFELAEFEAALREFFPHVRIWTQNHTGAIVFAPANPSATRLDAQGSREPEAAHFYLAVCGEESSGPNELFAWIPQSGNVLRERELHVAKLEGELAEKDIWLARSLADHATLQKEHEATLEELRAKNRWAESLNARIAETEGLVAALQNEANERLQWIQGLEAELERVREVAITTTIRLEADLAARTAWANSVQEELNEKVAHVRILLGETADLTNTIEGLLFTITDLKTERARAAKSKWMRLGAAIRVGPTFPDAEQPDAE